MSPYSQTLSLRLKLTEQITRALQESGTLITRGRKLLEHLLEHSLHKRTTRDKQEENRVFSALANMAKRLPYLLAEAYQHGNAKAVEQLLRRQQETEPLIYHLGKTIKQLNNKKGATR